MVAAMLIVFTTFNFIGADTGAEERHYLNYHVALAREFPRLRFYLTARMSATRDTSPTHQRAALLGFDNAEDAAEAMRSAAAAKLIDDTQAHLKDLRSLSIEGDWALPFAARKPGASCFAFEAEFDFKPEVDYATAERNYLRVHVEIARRLPGLRGYLIGRPLQTGGETRQRVAVCIFDRRDAFRQAFRSEVGRELSRDGEATIINSHVCHLDARVEL